MLRPPLLRSRSRFAPGCLGLAALLALGPAAGAAPAAGRGVDIGSAGSSVVSPIGPLTTTPSPVHTPTRGSRGHGLQALPDPTGRGADAALACGAGPLDWAGARRLLVAQGPALALSRDRIRAARADLLTAGERPNPTLSFGTAHYSPRDGIGPGRLEDKYLDSVLRVDQVVERGNKRTLRQAQAQRNIEAAELQAVDDRRTQELALFDAYADLRLAEVTLANARDQATLLDESLGDATQRAQAGKLKKADLVRHRIESLRGAADVLRAEAGVTAARVAVKALLGCPASRAEVSSRGLDLPADTPSLGAGPAQGPTPPGDTDAAIETRADVRAADARTEAAEANVELTRANLARDVDLGVQVENDPGPGSGRTLGFGIAVPLFLAHRFEGEIARAEADRLSAEDTAYAARVQAAGEVATTWAQMISAMERVRRARAQLLPESEQAAADAEAAYRGGKLELSDLLDARRTLRTVRLEINVAEDEALRARAAWDAARGQAPLGLVPLPTTDDIEATAAQGP